MIRTLGRETALQLKLFWRTPLAAFFTFAFPLMFLFLFNLLNGDATLPGGLRFSQFFTPAIATFAVITACYTNLAIGTAISRDTGVLKRIRGTPLPMGVHLAGRIGAALSVAVLSVIVMFAAGTAFYGVQILWSRVPVALLAMFVGAACFSALGLAIAAISPSGQTAPALANATILPLSFVSGIFFPLDSAPEWLGRIASYFPLRPMVESIGDAFNPLIKPSFPWTALGVMAVWFVIGLVVATKYFTWEPKTSKRRGSEDLVETTTGNRPDE